MNDESKKRGILLTYLKRYRKKKTIQMQNLIADLLNILDDGKKITRKQLLALKYFLLREREFTGFDADDLLQFFNPIIKTNTNAKSKDKKSNATTPTPLPDFL